MGRTIHNFIPTLIGLSRRRLGAERAAVTFGQEANMVASFTHSASHAADALWRVLSWPARVGAARRTMSELARI